MPYGWHLLRSSLGEDIRGYSVPSFHGSHPSGGALHRVAVAVQTGQCRRLPAPYPGPFGSSASASCAGSHSRWLHHTLAGAAPRCLLDGIPGVRLPGSAVSPRFRPLRTRRRPGGYAVTPAPGGRGLHPHGKLSYKVHTALAVYPEANASFRPTGRTSTNAVLIVQPHLVSICSMASRVPNTTRCVTPTRRRRRYDWTTGASSSAGRGIHRGCGLGPVSWR